MLARDVDPLLDVEYERGRLKRLRVGRSAAKLLLLLALLLVGAAFAAGGKITWNDVINLLPAIIR